MVQKFMIFGVALNEAQKKAVVTTEGKILVLAGAGSGKTKVIVHRIAHLIKKGIDPASILGLTFTNKAAAEMRERVAQLLSPAMAKKVILSTFHSFCMAVLRKEIHHLGYTSNFSLYDERDIRRLLKQIASEHHEEELSSVEPVYQEIARARSTGNIPEDAASQELYEKLQLNLRAFNAVDFDSLLHLTLELFENHPEVLAHYQERFCYIMIDEYQDTNPIQYKIAKLLSAKHENLCVVGDDDQSIYGWRGAEIKNILTFESTHIIKLQQNYRSRPNILQAANALIANNSQRHKKELFSKAEHGEPIVVFHAPSETEEASATIQRMLHLRKTRGYRWRDFAILYRSNILSRPFEMALMQGMWQKNGEWQRGIPYRVFGGTELYERREIKDLIAYLRLIANQKDEEALLRIINIPRRGISDKTLAILTQQNRREKTALWKILSSVQGHPELSERAIASAQNFVFLIQRAKDLFATKPLNKACKEFLEQIDYKRAIEEEVKSEKMRNFKWENVESCIETLRLYEEESEEPSLQGFLTTTMLDQDRFSKKEKNFVEDKVNVMTFHSAKGLEFEAVFLVSLEDHIIPHEKSFHLEEERRLLYVAITRAKQNLTLSMARSRKRYGKEEPSSPSRFLFEIPKELLRTVSWRNPF